MPGRVGVVAPPAPPRPQVRTRWGKTATTFGPAGRLIATFALLLPVPPMVIGGLVDPFVWGGLAVWCGLLMPWALRDVWKAGVVSG
jgi:hypothetical protein